VYGLVFACMELSDIEQAQKHFGRVLETEAQEDLRDLAKNELREIAARELKARGQYGLDINDPPESHVLRGAAEEGFPALQLIRIMYAGFKRIEPGMGIGWI
jgi:hypothetical protein